MDENILRILVCKSKFFLFEECDPMDFADNIEDYIEYMAQTLADKYSCVCIPEYCFGSEYAVQFVSDGDAGHRLAKRAFEEYTSVESGVISFNDFIEKVEGGWIWN